jgi:hypothetical protein
MRIRFTASASDGLWLHVDGPTKKAGFSLDQLAKGIIGQVLQELHEALLDGRDYGASPYYEVAAAAHTPAEALAMK